jgi:phage tail sheath protein FI
MAEPKIGFTIDTQGAETLVPSSAEMSVIGATVTAPNKTSGIEYNTLYRVNSDDAEFFTSLGIGGTAQQAMIGAGKQLGEMSRSTRMVINVVPEGANDQETMANIVGNPVTKTGVHLMKRAGQKVGLIPRILIQPGYTGIYVADGVKSLTINAGGTGYLVNDALTGTGGGGTQFAGKVTAVNGMGAITAVQITNSGSSYETNPTIAVTTAAGSGADISASVGSLANAVCAEVASVCDTILAVSPVTGPANNLLGAINWRETLASKRLIPTETDVIIQGPEGPITVPSDAYVAGLINRVDELHGGLPFHSAGNRALYGVLGPSRTIDFSLTDGDTEGQDLLNNDLGIIVNGETGDDFSIAEGGTIYLGVSTASNESLWQYYNQVRGRDWFHLTTIRTARELLARFNNSPRLAQTYHNTIKSIIDGLVARELIYRDYKLEYTPGLNAPADVRSGSLNISVSIEEPAPFLRSRIKSNRYEIALTGFVQSLSNQLTTAAL